jgi:hypothetical protein
MSLGDHPGGKMCATMYMKVYVTQTTPVFEGIESHDLTKTGKEPKFPQNLGPISLLFTNDKLLENPHAILLRLLKYIIFRKLAEGVMLLTYVREVPGSNLSQDTENFDC